MKGLKQVGHDSGGAEKEKAEETHSFKAQQLEREREMKFNLSIQPAIDGIASLYSRLAFGPSKPGHDTRAFLNELR